MARGLENVIRALADAGNFSHLSIISSGKGFHASFSPAASWGRGMAEHSDPVEAIMLAIDAALKKGKSKKVHSPAAGSNHPARSTVVDIPVVGGPQQANEPHLTGIPETYMVDNSYELIPVAKPKKEKQDGLGTILRDVAGVVNNDIRPIVDVTAPVTDLMDLFKNEDNDD